MTDKLQNNAKQLERQREHDRRRRATRTAEQWHNILRQRRERYRTRHNKTESSSSISNNSRIPLRISSLNDPSIVSKMTEFHESLMCLKPVNLNAVSICLVCIPMGSCTTFHWEVVTYLENCGCDNHFKPRTLFDLRCESITYVPYLSVLKPGSYTPRDSNIRWIVQQNEWNERLGLFKCRVPKLLNLINAKIVHYIMEN